MFIGSLAIYIVSMSIGMSIEINHDISDKKSYEVMGNNKAIISNYEGKFVVMDYKIEDNTIVLIRGTYRLEEMTGASITYQKFDKVTCE